MKPIDYQVNDLEELISILRSIFSGKTCCPRNVVGFAKSRSPISSIIYNNHIKYCDGCGEYQTPEEKVEVCWGHFLDKIKNKNPYEDLDDMFNYQNIIDGDKE